MRTVRAHVFETNSSSEHCMTIDKDRTPRTADEFPELNPDGTLSIEVTRFWKCSKECVTDVLRDIMEYILVLADACNDYKSGVEMIQAGYRTAGLTQPTDVILYVVDENGQRIPYLTGNFISVDNGFSRPEEESVSFQVDLDEHPDVRDFLGMKDSRWCFQVSIDKYKELREKFPDLVPEHHSMPIGKLPFVPHPAGITYNCMPGDSLDSSLAFLSSDWDYHEDVDITESFSVKTTLWFTHS